MVSTVFQPARVETTGFSGLGGLWPPRPYWVQFVPYSEPGMKIRDGLIDQSAAPLIKPRRIRFTGLHHPSAEFMEQGATVGEAGQMIWGQARGEPPAAWWWNRPPAIPASAWLAANARATTLIAAGHPSQEEDMLAVRGLLEIPALPFTSEQLPTWAEDGAN